MISVSSKQREEHRKQEAIRRQIALLQAQLKDSPSTDPPPAAPLSPKRKQPDTTVLAPCTPSPKKKKKLSPARRPAAARPAPSFATASSFASGSRPRPGAKHPAKGAPRFQKPAPSALVSKLASLANQPSKSAVPGGNRSSGFAERPQQHDSADERDDSGAAHAPLRDDRLALVEELELGPAEHKAPFDDPHFEKLEPNSGIRLSSRVVPHAEFQDYLRGRYYLAPSRLYSVVRLLPSKQAYDVPVEGDFVTIGVVAERGPVKVSKAPVTVGRDDDGPAGDEDSGQRDLAAAASKPAEKYKKGDKWDKSKTRTGEGPGGGGGGGGGRKYVNLKLVDFGARARSASSATGGAATLRGDAFLTLLLFEADSCSTVVGPDGRKENVYRGGSRGAFEAVASLREGAVIALLNPRILKPFQRSNDSPHPVTNILAVTPESAASALVLGYARDLGMCGVTKRDGKVCGSWCDKRVSDVCEYHVQTAVERKRAGRAEFSIGTSGMSNRAAPKRRPAYDAARQWGLRPEPGAARGDAGGGGGATYVVAGHVVSSAPHVSPFVGENIGREGQAKAARKTKERAAEKTLAKMLERDREGMRAVLRAREVGSGESAPVEAKAKDGGKGKGKGKGKAKETASDGHGEALPDADQEGAKKRNAFSASVVKRLGFDPTVKAGQRRADEGHVRQKLDELSAFQSTRSEIRLGARPGKKQTTVCAPPRPAGERTASSTGTASFDGDDSDDELERAEMAAFGKPVGLRQPSAEAVDLGDGGGSSDLEIEPPIPDSPRSDTVDIA